MAKDWKIDQEKVHVQPFSATFKNQAYQIYSELRTHDPVHKIRMTMGEDAWLITRYEDAEAVLKDNRRFTKNPAAYLAKLEPMMERDLLINHMLNTDPPDHTRLRALVQKAFTPRMINQLRDRIQGISEALLDKVQEQGKMELIDDFAFPLPIIVISEMLGIPQEDRDRFREWSNTIVACINHPDKRQQSLPQIRAFAHYLQELIQYRRREPAEDLVSALVQAESEGDTLTEHELSSMVFLLIVAGHETTVNLIGNGVLALLQYPEQMKKLQQQPELIHSAIEECLRYSGPVEIATNRWAVEDIPMHDKVIPRGDLVAVVLASANRDENHFREPDRFDIQRKHNPHLAFGLGIHYCLGAPLARLEGQIAIQTLLRRMPNLGLDADPETLRWRESYLMRGLEQLPVVF